ncbi:hypothetical protein [Marivita geojedonensis]|uniref:Uncharacterized protein n=1 Tax=Marivita geojedonensis TaxID=1123756 RepID=A0A1X4N8A5_9RHOB|nr:hypothetical protein [Marivita geojedonensis]OSQ42473.1 hypothetical protein MGEO_20525 [Marivita geojedonensis]PRY71420.1 hypothetical protein CLV76_1437 [Marivita geojedonensis]
MLYHSKKSSEFVGLRTGPSGQRQIVYDAQKGKRVVLIIESHSALISDIDAALQEGINSRNVVGGIIAALKARNIDVDFDALT